MFAISEMFLTKVINLISTGALYKQTNILCDKSFHLKEMVTSIAVSYKLDVVD
jgi:hypothetical protein